MYCFSCGKAIADDAASCPYCGAVIEISDDPFADSVPVYAMPASAPVYHGVPDKPKKKTGIIIAIVVVLLAMVGAGLYTVNWYYNRPIMLITQAVKEDDIQTVIDLFDELDREEDIDYVERSMASYATRLQNDFVNYDKDYDEVMEELELLGKDILKDNSRYDRLVKDIEDLNRSRENFKEAEEAFKNEDYEKALELYSLVSLHDEEHYKTAKNQIEEIKKLMIPDVVGTWRTTIDVAPALISVFNIDRYSVDSSLLNGISMPMDLLLIFKEDNECTITVDNEAFVTDFDAKIDAVMNLALAYVSKQYGMDVDELNKYFNILYGKDCKDYFLEEFDPDSFKKEFIDTVESETINCFYSMEDNLLYVYREKSDMKKGSDYAAMCLTLYDNRISIEKNTMSINHRLEMCIEYPLIFTKDN